LQRLLNKAFVDSHLEQIPRLGTFTVGRLAGRDLQVFGWQTNRPLDAEVLVLATLDQLGADLLEGLEVAGGEGDADLVGFLANVNQRLA